MHNVKELTNLHNSLNQSTQKFQKKRYKTGHQAEDKYIFKDLFYTNL